MTFELPETLESRTLADDRYIEIVPNDRADIIGRLPTLLDYFRQVNFLPIGYRIVVNTLNGGNITAIYIEGFGGNNVYGIFQIISNYLFRAHLLGNSVPYVFTNEESDRLKEEFRELYDYLLKI